MAKGVALGEEIIGEVVRLRLKEGLDAKQIALKLGVSYQSVTRELRKRDLGGRMHGGRKLSKIEEHIYTKEEQAQMRERDPTTQIAIPKPTPPATPAEMDSRTTKLAGNLLATAERLTSSIQNMSDEALAATTLTNKATALGIIVDKIKVLMNQTQTMFGPNNQTINIVNVIAQASPPRAKDAGEVIDVTPTEADPRSSSD